MAASTSFVMTVLGPDRPGLVESIAKVTADQGGNWIESRMAHLGGQFAGIVHVEVPEKQAESLQQALETLDLTIQIQAESASEAQISRKTLSLELIGQDRPGIVREITGALAKHQINVEELATECSSAPMSGETLFKATAQLSLPGTASSDQLREDLETIANDLTLEIDLIERSSV